MTIKCPNCQGTNLKKNGMTSGNQRYVCKNCGRSFTGNPPGRPTESDRPTLTVNFSYPLLATIKGNALIKKLSVSQYLEQILVNYFEEN